MGMARDRVMKKIRTENVSAHTGGKKSSSAEGCRSNPRSRKMRKTISG